jgi:hypothetical protein
MDASYVAGFFDGEGSAMVLTIRRQLKSGTIYRLRPVIKIAQRTRFVLDVIRDFLECGTVVGERNGMHSLQINGNAGIRHFVDLVSPFCVIKQKQLLALREVADYQDRNFTNQPYTREALEHLLDLRDGVFTANTWSRSHIRQKYSKEVVLADNTFVDVVRWKAEREQARHDAHGRYYARRNET